MEMICTAIFATLILHIKRINGSAKEDVLNAASVATALYMQINTVGISSGGCFNPAVGIAQTTY